MSVDADARIQHMNLDAIVRCLNSNVNVAAFRRVLRSIGQQVGYEQWALSLIRKHPWVIHNRARKGMPAIQNETLTHLDSLVYKLSGRDWPEFEFNDTK
ncbi:hypothetical protein YK56LOC_68910 [Caballeronia sp. HLA56]